MSKRKIFIGIGIAVTLIVLVLLAITSGITNLFIHSDPYNIGGYSYNCKTPPFYNRLLKTGDELAAFSCGSDVLLVVYPNYKKDIKVPPTSKIELVKTSDTPIQQGNTLQENHFVVKSLGQKNCNTLAVVTFFYDNTPPNVHTTEQKDACLSFL